MMGAEAVELNVDGMVGPTHHYAGLSAGNVASELHRHETSNPRAAALQGLAKMKRVSDMGVPQAVMPPQARPDLEVLRAVGFDGSDADVLREAQREAPVLLSAACSASSMWSANAATVCPSADSADGRVHFTPANLVSETHRAIESATTARLLARIFPEGGVFTHHAPLPGSDALRDEGAANHTRLCRDYGETGVQLFVFGRHGLSADVAQPKRYRARQAREASEAVARLHGLNAQRVVFAQQHPDAIDAGVFHNDVAMVGDRDVLFYHRGAVRTPNAVVDKLQCKYEACCGGALRVLSVSAEQVPMDEAVRTYLFNSQIVRGSDGATVMIAPQQCAESPHVQAWLEGRVGGGGPIDRVVYVDLQQSMRNGGGPACLRLRVALRGEEHAHVHRGVMLDDALYARLTDWVGRWYRDELKPGDLADPRLLEEGRGALDALTRVLGLGAVYGFQR